MGRKLKFITIRGYKSIREATVELQDINILIGSNGAGKSNFISLFKFLNQIIMQQLQNTVLSGGGAEKFLFMGSKETEKIEIEFGFPPNYYYVKLAPRADDSLFVREESIGYEPSLSGIAWKNILIGGLESSLKKARPYNKIATNVFPTLRRWKVYHFHDTSSTARMKKMGDINDNLYFREDASNLAAFLYLMQQKHPRHLARIEQTIQLAVPMFKSFLLRPVAVNEETIRLEWFSKNSDYIFSASELSDGSLRFICIAVLLLQPNPPDLILLDEPELGLHPSEIQLLAGLIQKAAHGSQVIISTQSSELVSQFHAEDIIVVENENGASVFERQSEEKLKDWLAEYKMGEIWDKNIIGGRP